MIQTIVAIVIDIIVPSCVSNAVEIIITLSQKIEYYSNEVFRGANEDELIVHKIIGSGDLEP